MECVVELEGDFGKREELPIKQKLLLKKGKELLRKKVPRYQFVIFSLSWLFVWFFVPLWINSFDKNFIYGYNITPADPGLKIDPFNESCVSCHSIENPHAVSFQIVLSCSLTRLPTTGSFPYVFAATSLDGEWWVAAQSEEYLKHKTQSWVLPPSNQCLGDPGRLYMVFCLPKEDIKFEVGEVVDGPPFDSRCFALGSRCGATCGTAIQPPPQCNKGLIPYDILISKNCTMENHNCTVQPKDTYGAGVWTFMFFFFSMFSLVNFLVNHCAPVGATLDLLLCGSDPEPTSPIRGTLTVGVASIFCQEGLFHIIRNVLGVAQSWNKVRPSHLAQDPICVHYILDNSATNFTKNSPLPEFISSLFDYIENLTQADLDTICYGLHRAPVQPTVEQYKQMLPKDIQMIVQEFLDKDDTHSTYWKGGRLSQKRKHRKGQVTKGKANRDDDASTTLAETTGNNCKILKKKVQVNGRTIQLFVLSATTFQARSKPVSLSNCVTHMNNFFQNNSRFLALMDARHQMTPEFWAHTLPNFFVGNEEKLSLRWVQVMQYFPVVDKTFDFFDRGNWYNYLYANSLRETISSTTSCGTNAIWSLRDHASGPFRFHGETRIEDTETSHACFLEGEDSYYIAQPLVYGSVKEPIEYGEAPSRWASGAIELCGVEIRRCKAHSFCLLLACLVIYLVIPGLYAFLVYFIIHAQWVIIALFLGHLLIFLLAIACIGPNAGKKMGRFIIRMVNISYWLTGPAAAIFWMDVMPVLLLLARSPPFTLNIQLMIVGGLLTLLAQWVITSLVTAWNGTQELHLWRSQQVWFGLWPLSLFLGVPAIVYKWIKGDSTWSVSKYQATVTFIVNVLQMALLAGSCVYGVTDLISMISYSDGQISLNQQTISLFGSRIIGLVCALTSFLLITPITVSLGKYLFQDWAQYFQCTKTTQPTEGFGLSMRHITLVFLLALTLVLYGFNFSQWNWHVFETIFTSGTPHMM